jgi:acyl-CoA thioesterase
VTQQTSATDATHAFLGLEVDVAGKSGWFTVEDALLNPTGTLFGGAGVAASVALMEAITERRVQWTTLQFVTTPARGDRVDCSVEVVAHGGRMSQLRVRASTGGAEVFSAIGATGVDRDDVTVTFDQMASVPPPEDCPPVQFGRFSPEETAHSYFGVIDRREAGGTDALRGSASHAALWVRVAGMQVTTPMLGYFGDVAAFGVFRALGRPLGRATSVDNTLRLGPMQETEWVLLDMRSQFVAGGYAHATVDMWSRDGALLGLMSQTVALRTAV